MQQMIRDCSRARPTRGFAAAVALVLFAAGQASATGYPPPPPPEPPTPDSQACATVTESEFTAYIVEKCVEVWAPDNPGNPDLVPGNFTYLYTLESSPSSITNIIQFDIEAPTAANAVSDAGFTAGTGDVDPSAGPAGDAVQIVPGNGTLSGTVRYRFQATQGAGEPCEGIAGLCPGAKSSQLLIHSPYGPGSINDNLVTLFDDFSLDEESTCIGPSTLPNPTPCSALFWKLRALFHLFCLKHFPNEQWDQLKQFAADTSSVFSDPEEVVQALFHGYFWFGTTEAKAERELAALLLNIAGGELFPGNTKCRLFFDTPVDSDGDGIGDTTVGEQLVIVESNILSGDPALILEAKSIALKLNLGIGVLDTTIF